jgi:hypothetical protein
MIENQLESKQAIKSPQKKLLLENAEELIKDIQAGKSYRFLSDKWKVHQEVIWWFINVSEHCARAKQAQLLSSYELIEQAEQAIDEIKADDTPATVRRQVEKMNLLLFKAKTKNRKELDFTYKDPATVEIANIIPQLTIKTIEPILEPKKTIKNNKTILKPKKTIKNNKTIIKK